MSPNIAFLSRSNAAAQPTRRPPAWLLPIVILIGFAAIFLILFQDRLLPAAEAHVATVLATAEVVPESQSSQPSTPRLWTSLFQASGWVEPNPYAVKASSLIDGIVATLHVLEGQSVKKDELLATLVDEDAKLKLALAEGKLRILSAEREATVSAVLAGVSKREAFKAEVLAAETLALEAKDQLQRFEVLVGAVISDSDVVTARLRVQREQANLASARAKFDEQLAEIKRSEAATAAKDEEISLSRVSIAQEKLNLDRTRILAPITGRVLRLNATPGEKKMLAMDHPDSSTIAVLYDPAQVQVRVDVPLADAARLQIGQKTRVHCNVLPNQVFEGVVTRIAGEADLQRNTLQAKIRIIAPSEVLRPEMLCRVEFLGGVTDSNNPKSRPTDAGDLAMWIPREAVKENAVWVFDPVSSRVSKRTVKPSTDTRDNYVRIHEGLRLGEQVVLSPTNLHEGQRIKPNLIQL